MICLLEASSDNASNHFVVLVEVNEREATVFDPAVCTIGKVSRSRFDACFSVMCVVFPQSRFWLRALEAALAIALFLAVRRARTRPKLRPLPAFGE